ncbi:hypothetical protein F5X98DRAFT_210465 [Xylaria grammica]|nr:hypothetical protein F5X98DRAFT_210465 [Xylaria grammica]
MAVIEIALPKLKKDAQVIQDVDEKVIPGLNVKLTKAGILNGLRGFFVTEDGRDVREDFREVLVLQWPSAQHFRDFVASAAFAEFSSGLKQYSYGPAELKLLDVAGDGTSIYGKDTAVIEYLAVKPKDASEAGVQSALKKLQSGLSHFGTEKVVVGSSINLETQEIAVVSAYTSEAELETVKASAGRQQLLADIASIANVSNLVGHVKKEVPLAEQ